MNLNYRGGLTRVLAAIIITILLASCGQKGDLYLPGDQKSALSRTHIDT